MTRKPPIPRWHVVVRYNADAGPVEVEYDIEELDELHALIERGPDWNTLVDIKVTLARTTGRVTLEAAARE